MALDALSNVAWLLLGGASFFTAMRYAVRHHTNIPGHFDLTSASGESVNTPLRPTTSVRDPVCGMSVAPSDDISWIHNGHTYYFCSMSCRGRFRTAPEQFIGPRGVVSDSHA